MRRPLTLPFFILLAAGAHAADVQVVFPAGGKYVVFGADAVPEAVPDDALHVQAKSATVTSSGTMAFVGDESTGRVVATTWDALAKKTPINFNKATYLARVVVRVTSDGGSVGGASATWQDDERTHKGVADPIARGELAFTMVRLGTAKIDVTYPGKDGKERVQHNQVQVRDASPITLSVTGASTEVPPETGSAPTTGAGTGQAPASTPAPAPANAPPVATNGGATGNILSTLIGIAVVGGLAYAAWRYAQANPEKVKDTLTKIGADVPKPLDPDDPPAATPATTPAPPTPSGPIILDPTPEPIVVSSAPISLSAAPTGVPKLLGTDGSAFELPEGETVVGRGALGGLMISHDTVSRRHARLLRSGSSVTVEDLGSTNGTWVNDAPAPATLNGGETVRFGQVTYRFEA